MAAESLEVRVRLLEDIEQIRNMIAKYGFLIDDLQPATAEAQLQEFLNLFTDDVVYENTNDTGTGRTVQNGKAEFLKWLRQGASGVANSMAFTVHEAFTPWIEVDGDRAVARIYTLSPGMQGPPGERRAFWTHGAYRNEYRRVNGKWLIKLVVYTRSFLTPYEVGWHKVGFYKDLGERGRGSVLPPEHANLIEESGDRVQAGPGERWRDQFQPVGHRR
jgi:hypothetical protein